MTAARSRIVLRDLEFGLLPRHGWRSLALALAVGLGFGVYMALADAWLFADTIPDVQRQLVAEMATDARIAWFARQALVDEVLFRLIGLTALAWCVGMLTGKTDARCIWAAILLTAFVIYPIGSLAYFQNLNPTALTGLREVLLHGTAGTLWGWLYWRHGWSAGVAGHLGAHLTLQPLLGIL